MGRKESNEITVKIKGTLEELYKILEKKQFQITEKFSINDTYFIPQNLDIDKISTREILSKAVLVRDITRRIPIKKSEKTLTFKKKEIDLDGNIINQNSIDCEVLNIEDAKNFMKAIGYKSIMTIKEDDIVYEKDGFELAVKDIENGDKLIEAETNEQFSTIEELKQKITQENIPIYENDYFVKKAEIELSRILGK